MVLPPPVKVDYRAACFCHRELIDIGFVCSVCLSSKSVVQQQTHGLPTGLFLSNFEVGIVNSVISHVCVCVCATCPAHLVVLDLIALLLNL